MPALPVLPGLRPAGCVLAALLATACGNTRGDHHTIGVIDRGEEAYDYAPTDDKLLELPAPVREALIEPFSTFVTRTDGRLARELGSAAADTADHPDRWDAVFFEHTARSVAQHVRSRRFFGRLEAVRAEYATTLAMLRDADLPEVLAAIPYTESGFRADRQSQACARGYWQFMPETASRLGLEVRDCPIRTVDGSTRLWTPTEAAPTPRKSSPYLSPTGPLECLIAPKGCEVDERDALEASTAAAIAALREAFDDPTLRASGAVVQATILSHSAGYDDARFGLRKGFNVLPAFQAWSKGRPVEEHARFYGDNIRCTTSSEAGFCGSKLPSETQHMGYATVARHLLAVCYYAQNHADDPAFAPWTPWVDDDAYCSAFRIPTTSEMAAWR